MDIDQSSCIRKRVTTELSNQDYFSSSAPSDDEDEKLLMSEKRLEKLTRGLPQASDHTTKTIDDALSSFSARWRNWIVRGVFSVVMITGFMFIIYMGPSALMTVILLIQIKCFQEIIYIGYAVYHVHKLPWFRSLSWYFLITSNYFFYGLSMIDYFEVLLRKDQFLRFLVVHHRFISFVLYLIGFIWFVLSLVKHYYLRQFSMFAWTHVSLLLVVSQSYLIIQNTFQGIIWLIVPVSMIICNDISAYLFGFFFGRTPLIKISPKKTWEGFLGGAVCTIIFGFAMSYALLRYPYFICPVHFSEDSDMFTTDCHISSTFQLQEYELPIIIASIAKTFGLPPTFRAYPFMFHTLAMSLFASLIGPFGGFFASGFKRAFKIKDFGAIIPGHGGLMDRFDCQLLMGTFVNVFIQTFIRESDPTDVVKQILFMKPEQQVEVFLLLFKELSESGALNSSMRMNFQSILS